MWIYGKHAVKAVLKNPNRMISRLVILESRKDSFDANGSPRPEVVDRNFFDGVFGKDATHQGCAVLVNRLPRLFLEDLISDEADDRPLIMLDRVGDPQNVGSILRAAAVFGARAVVVAEDNSPDLTPTVMKAASGAAESVPTVRVVNLVHAVNDLKKKGFWCVGLDEKAPLKICETSLSGKILLVIGGEGEGLRRLTRESCDFLVRLPYSGNFGTLNAAQAATVSLYELMRQKEQNK
jgi:23S rRNA (guanosine2251-2'-O)-methyltransferase